MTSEVVTLVWPTEEDEERTAVFAEISSVGQKEFFAAAQTGLKPELRVVVWADEYDGQPIVEVGDRRLTVYRNYLRSDGKVELYLTEKAGLQ